MKLKAEIEGEVHDVEFTRDGRTVTATVDGRTYHLDASEPEANVFLFKNDNKVTEAYVSPAAAGISNVRVGSHEFRIKLTDPKRLRGSETDGASVHGMAEMRTAMPGKIVRVIAAVGDQVEKGDGIIVVEAMKMQNELRSPKDGIVKEIRFEEGSTVRTGDILAVIE
ncbi:MAG: biotin/lipoyl-containing protein [Acidobacteriota bacterium]